MWRPQYTFFQNRQLFWINLCGKKTCCQLENRRVQSIPLLMDTSGKEGGWSGAYVNGGCVWGGEEISCGWGLDGWESITLLLFVVLTLYTYTYTFTYTPPCFIHPKIVWLTHNIYNDYRQPEWEREGREGRGEGVREGGREHLWYEACLCSSHQRQKTEGESKWKGKWNTAI